jgi:hypothetical protein
MARGGIGGGVIPMAKCSGITQAGTACKGIPIDGSGYCYAHHPGRIEERRRYGSKGGKRGGRGRPQAELSDIKRRLSGLADDVLEGRQDKGVAAVASQVLNVYLRAVELGRRIREQNDLEARLDELEGLLEEAEERTYARR